jgi:predicted AAA+ superfamily ATPase
VSRLDPVTLDSLVGIDFQKEELVLNTRRFMEGQPANNALLWGARGTGKSSLVKAVFNRFAQEGLRLIQVERDDLEDLTEIVDGIRDLSWRFILFCDDLSFEPGENSYRHLKSVLEGSIELPPENLLVYATSNRRHLVPEMHSDNRDARFEDGEIHYGDSVEEKISLSDRFGLSIPFGPVNQDGYLAIIDTLFGDFKGDRTALHEAARVFALGRGSRSGRTARQFYNTWKK